MGKFKSLFLLITVLVLILSACAPKEDATDEVSEGDGSYELVKKGSLTFAASGLYKPFNFEENGELTGFDIEIGNAISEKLGLNQTR